MDKTALPTRYNVVIFISKPSDQEKPCCNHSLFLMKKGRGCGIKKGNEIAYHPNFDNRTWSILYLKTLSIKIGYDPIQLLKLVHYE